jgi:hypothetical protein
MVETKSTLYDLNILVSSCDEFADVWDPFFILFDKYWPDCPFPIFLSSVKKPYHSNSVQQILVEERMGWGDGVIKAIKILQRNSPSEFLLLLLDDYLISEKVETEKIVKAFHVLKSIRGNYLRLIPKPGPDAPVENHPFIGHIKKNSPYRCSLQASIWRTETLLSLLRPTETPWDMEVLGSQRAKYYDGFYCTYKPQIKYLNGIKRGKWTFEAYTFLNEQDLCDNLTNRQIASTKEKNRKKIQIRRFFSKVIPLRIRLFFRQKISKITKKNIK